MRVKCCRILCEFEAREFEILRYKNVTKILRYVRNSKLREINELEKEARIQRHLIRRLLHL